MENFLWVIGSIVAGIVALLFGVKRKKLRDAKQVQLENLHRGQNEQANVLDIREKARVEAATVAHAKVEEELLSLPEEPTISDATVALQKLQKLKSENGS